MKVSLFAAMFSVAAAALLATATVSAQGVIVPIVCELRPCRPIPRPIPRPLPNVLPVKSIDIDTKINGQIATTRVEQIFRNDTPYTLEGTYFFPIPDSASISSFAIWENGQKLVGEVRSREEARRIYDEIVRRQRDPGLLEYAGKDLFQASIFPIPPNSDKKLELIYTQVLKAEAGTVAYRYPLGTGRNLWRNDPAADSAGRPQPQQPFGSVSGRIEISGREQIRNIYSPTHTINTAANGTNKAVVTFETRNSDSDFQLFHTLSNAEFGMSLLTYREPGQDGFFLLTLSPREDVGERSVVSKDVVFVLDTSGSMAEAGKMEKARAALLFGIRTLREGDRFNVVSFAGGEHVMETGLIAADAKGKKRGEDFVGALNPNGGTNINDSLVASLKQFDRSDRPKILVFMTDGLPTVGERSVEKITANVKAAKNVDVRIFPFGFGYDVNTTLLDKLGSDNGGMSDYVQPKEDLEVKVSNFFSRVSSPVLSDLQLDLGSVATADVYPRQLTDLFKGMQLTVIGRYRNERDLQNVVATLRGKSGTRAVSFEYRDLVFPERATANDFLPRLWATRRVGWLVEQIRLNGENKELVDEVTQLGTRYGIVTPYTSYLATDGTFQFVERDAGGRMVQAPAAKRAMEARSGADAVQMSVQQNTMQTNVSIAADAKMEAERQVVVGNSAQNQFVANKNFFNQNGVWIDADVQNNQKLREVTVQFGSAEYYALAAAQPELARYLALGDQVTVVWNDRIYRVVR